MGVGAWFNYLMSFYGYHIESKTPENNQISMVLPGFRRKYENNLHEKSTYK